MSCVAEAKADIQNSTSVAENSDTSLPVVRGSEKASAAKRPHRSNCMAVTHQRLVLRMSTKGLQKGLMSQGRYSRLVYRAISAFPIPIRLNRITEMLLITKYGIPSAKYREGTQSQGERGFIGWCRDNRRTGFHGRTCRKRPLRRHQSGTAPRHAPIHARGRPPGSP